MTGKIIIKKNSLIIVAIIIIILAIVFSKNELFVPENKIINNFDFETPKSLEIFSCQVDCTLNDDLFHEECIGYNGCEDSPFLRDKSYCEQDSDCKIDFGCCAKECENCIGKDFCSVSNNVFIKAHSFSCKNILECKASVECNPNYESICQNNKCLIIS